MVCSVDLLKRSGLSDKTLIETTEAKLYAEVLAKDWKTLQQNPGELLAVILDVYSGRGWASNFY